MTVVRGRERLQAAPLPPAARNRRVVAGCCASPMYVDVTGGHWLGVFRARLGPAAPRPELCCFTADRPAGPPLPDDLPHYPGVPLRLAVRLLGAWVAMGFRRPRFTG